VSQVVTDAATPISSVEITKLLSLAGGLPGGRPLHGPGAGVAAWEDAFHDRPVVTLCPYMVGGLSAGRTLDRLDGVSSFHDAVLLPSEATGFRLLRT
jgi:hypothetical protein